MSISGEIDGYKLYRYFQFMASFFRWRWLSITGWNGVRTSAVNFWGLSNITTSNKGMSPYVTIKRWYLHRQKMMPCYIGFLGFPNFWRWLPWKKNSSKLNQIAINCLCWKGIMINHRILRASYLQRDSFNELIFVDTWLGVSSLWGSLRSYEKPFEPRCKGWNITTGSKKKGYTWWFTPLSK